MRQAVIRLIWILMACMFIAGVSAVVQLVLGRAGMSPTEAIAALSGNPVDNSHALIMRLRLPRVAGAIGAGALLAVAGVLMRYVTANPLAEPGVLGVSAGAALGVVVANTVGFGAVGTTIPALLGALATFALVHISSSGVSVDRVRLVLTGVVIGSVVSALTAGVLAATGRPLGAVLRWLIGSLNAVTYADLKAALIPASLGIVLLFAAGRRLGALRLPTVEAITIGAQPDMTRMLALAAAVTLTCASVLIAGAVAFLGLAAPEIARRILRNSSPVLMIPASAAIGAAVLALADVIAVRTTLAVPGLGTSVTGLPVGALVAPVCIPFVLFALARRWQ